MSGLIQSFRRWYQRHLSYQPSRTYMRGPGPAGTKDASGADGSNNSQQMT